MSKLWLKAHQACVSHTTGVGRKTSILFSIDDRTRIAWYRFSEHSQVFNTESDQDFYDGKAPTVSSFGHPVREAWFHTRKDRSFDEFGVGAYLHPNQARAHIAFQFLNNHIYIGMTVFLDGGPENLVLQFDSNQPPQHVRHHEQGYVLLVKTEPYSASTLTKKRHFGWKKI